MLRWRYPTIRCCRVGWQTGQTGRRRQMSRKWASGAVHFSRTGGQISCKLGNGRLASHLVEVVVVVEVLTQSVAEVVEAVVHVLLASSGSRK